MNTTSREKTWNQIMVIVDETADETDTKQMVLTRNRWFISEPVTNRET